MQALALLLIAGGGVAIYSGITDKGVLSLLQSALKSGGNGSPLPASGATLPPLTTGANPPSAAAVGLAERTTP
jgi:hypothetical protein